MTKKKTPVVKKKGRPRKAEDLISVSKADAFGRMNATQETMAEYFGVDISTIERKMRDPENPFCRAYKKGRSGAAMKLSETLYRAATVDKNIGAMIFLSKQSHMLGYRDKPLDVSNNDINDNQCVVAILPNNHRKYEQEVEND